MSSTAGVLPRLTAHTELYAAVPSSSGAPSLTFSYLRPTPIAVATNAPTVLVIGQAENYQVVVRDLSYSDFDSAHAVPVQGGLYVDDYTAQDLAQFDEVLIYGGRAHDSARAFDLVSGYVKGARGLIIESWRTPLARRSDTKEPNSRPGSTSPKVTRSSAF